ncbi:MAG: hypothetical protein ABIJ09_03805 [Pseudomonadota bacterium]
MSLLDNIQTIDLVFLPMLLLLVLAVVVEFLASYQMPPFSPGISFTRS